MSWPIPSRLRPLDDPLDASILFADHLSDASDWYITASIHKQCLKQQAEITVGGRTWRFDVLDPALGRCILGLEE